MPYVLPELPYSNAALEPYIDARTMEIHHDKHHAAYVTNVNNAIKDKPTGFKANRGSYRRSRLGTRGHSHCSAQQWRRPLEPLVFWEIMAPNAGGKPSGALATALDAAFGSFEAFQEKFQTAAVSRFGSGWAWLSVKSDKTLGICSTPNQDNPLMVGVVECTGTPVLGVDVWEHAYYLNYQNRRPDYLKAWWNVVNWPAVHRRYEEAVK